MKLSSGNLFTIAAPSGTGKTTLVKSLIDSLPNITVSVSHTTRPKRPLEEHGINYYFTDENLFRQMIAQNDFLEYATVFNHFYGTSRTWVENTLAQGMDVILEIDWQGCQQITKLFPAATSIFILPPSLDALSKRLCARNQDKPHIIQERLADARAAVSHIQEFEYLVINDDFDLATLELKKIIEAKRLLCKRQSVKFAPLLASFDIPKSY